MVFESITVTDNRRARRDQTNTVRQTRSANHDLEDRPFIAWDGEGINLAGTGCPQSYVLFGSTEDSIISKDGLDTFDCLEHIIATGQKNPRAIHIGFAFSYDANMICKTLAPMTLARLHKQGWVRVKKEKGPTYVITFARGKYFRVTKQLPGYDAKRNKTAKVTVQIYDIFSFFACSFIKAYEEMVGPIPEIIKSGKGARSNFSLEEFDEMETYWTLEVELMRELADELRKRVYNAGLRISQWHGPGSLATFAMRANGIKSHMADTSDAIREAARYAYAGGRFELFRCGRILGRIYSFDINSAYPFAISQLPSLTDGTWTYVKNPNPRKLARFGVYHVRQSKPDLLFERKPGNLFHRDSQHNISFPWHVAGWYWSPEAGMAGYQGAEILEGWEFKGGRNRPFSWIPEMYATRQDWKARGISAQIALKLCMNSCYGKLAQRVGWSLENQRIPPFHQLEWAGWVTSYVRTMLYMLMAKIPFEKLIAVETDGIFTTCSSQELGIKNSKQLGGWEIKEYEEMLYVQSGLAWMRDTDGWHSKRRGLDPCRAGHTPDQCDCAGTFSLNACRTYLHSLHPKPNGDQPWLPYRGQTTRFVGMGQALQGKVPMSQRHCVWETVPREIGAGSTGKRVHIWSACDACRQGLNAFDMAHDLVIHSRSSREQMSTPHSIPWEGNDDANALWRQHQDDEDTYVGMM